MTDGLEVTNDVQAKRFVARLDGDMAVAEYQFKAPVIIFTHTEVPPALRGGGIAGELVQAALDDSRERGYEVVPLCPYVASWIRRHRGYADLVPERFQYLIRGDLPGRGEG